jgi:hypothetical protein
MKIFEAFKGDKGEFSSKRVIGIIGAFVLMGSMIYHNTDKLIEAVEYITIFTLGFTTIDKFSNNKKPIE